MPGLRYMYDPGTVKLADPLTKQPLEGIPELTLRWFVHQFLVSETFGATIPALRSAFAIAAAADSDVRPMVVSDEDWILLKGVVESQFKELLMPGASPQIHRQLVPFFRAVLDAPDREISQ